MAIEELDEAQPLAWEASQGINFSVDLITAAKKQLQFLALVENSPKLLEEAVLQRAICRLNPLRYAKDCKRLFKKMLDAPVPEESSGEDEKKTEALWEKLYPNEPFNLNMENLETCSMEASKPVEYNLLNAVLRQQPFYYQVSQPHYLDERFLRAAEQRYKGFLHLMREEKNTFFVPTYDIDLMWHAHQLCPLAYGKDLIKVLGRVLDHDDTDSDRTKGQKLDTGFTKTRELWQNTYGFPYEKAGSMYRGAKPQSVPKPQLLESLPGSKFSWKDPSLARRKTLQVRLAIHSARGVPTKNASSTFLSMSTFQNCLEFKTQTCEVKASPTPEWNKLWNLECDSEIGGLVLELRQRTKGIFKGVRGSSKLIGSLTITWKMILQSSLLSLGGWFPLHVPENSNLEEFPSIRLDISVTPPVDAPNIMKFADMVKLVKVDRKLFTRESWSSAKVIDDTNQELYNVQTRSASDMLKTIQVDVNKHGQKKNFHENEGPVLVSLARKISTSSRQWSLYGSSGVITIIKNDDCQPEFEISGCFDQPMMILVGRKLQFDLRGAAKNQDGFATLIRYTSEAPNGKATGLFNWKTGHMEIMPEESSMLVAAFLAATATSMSEMSNEATAPKHPAFRSKSSIDLRGTSRLFSWHRRSKSGTGTGPGAELNKTAAGCGGGGCGPGGCGAMKGDQNGVHQAGCGSGCGGCGAMLTSGGCGAGCGGGCGGCGAMLKSGGCGAGCGGGCGGCGAMFKSAGCGAGCGGGCGGCGAMLKAESCGRELGLEAAAVDSIC